MLYIKTTFGIIHFFYFFFLILNIRSSNQAYQNYSINIFFNENPLDYLNIEMKEYPLCEKWVPSLFNPVFLVNSDIKTEGMTVVNLQTYELKCPVLSENELKINLFYYTKSNFTLAKLRFGNYDKCYYGLSYKYGEYKNILNETKILLDQLKNKTIDKKIFSFKKWTINENSINTAFYIGDSHENFISKVEGGIVGSCKDNDSDPYWGCSFKGMAFQNNYTDLIDENGDLYKIYLSSEDYTIVFPESFKEKFDNLTNNSCNSTEEEDIYKITCDNFFDKLNYTTIKLIGDEMNITVEIDNVARFSQGNIKNNLTRIKYVKGANYFIFPLIMFKQFHIQFDAENNSTSFFTTDSSILEVKKDEKKKDKNNSSKGFTVFLVILIIVAILALGYGIFWLLKKRRNSVESNINKYNKYEDEENFKDMNEKRIF